MREKLNFFELALAMESYPSAPPASVAAQIEQQLRQVTAPTTGTHEHPLALMDGADE